MPTLPHRAPAERFTLIIELLCRVTAARIARAPRLAGPLIILICGRLSRLGARFRRLAARIEAGTKPVPARRRAATRTGPARISPPLPRGFAWLVRLVGHEAAAGRSQLQYLLADPEMAALIADPRMGRILRPLCRMLGLRPPPGLLVPPAPPAAAPPCPAGHAAPPPASPQPAAPLAAAPLAATPLAAAPSAARRDRARAPRTPPAIRHACGPPVPA